MNGKQQSGRQIPTARWSAFATVARASKVEPVVVLCLNRTVRRQYQRVIPQLGGNLANVIFCIPDETRP